MKKLVLGTIAAAMVATSGLAAEYTLKFSHVVSPNTPKGKAADFFEVAKYGEATYKINTVTYADENNATINGTLNLKGASLPVSFNAVIRSADEKGLFAEAFFSMDRTLFGINYGIGNIAKDVQVAVHLFATK